MLTVWEAINKRRSIRHFTKESVPDDMIIQILNAGRLAPSAGNSQPWSFAVSRDEKTKIELSQICWNQQFIAEAPVVITCFGDLDRYTQIRDSALRYRKYLGHSSNTLTQDKLIFVIINAAIAIEQMVLMAASLELGTTIVGGFGDSTRFNQLFDLPYNFVPVAVIPVGYPAELPEPRPRRSMEDLLVNS